MKEILLIFVSLFLSSSLISQTFSALNSGTGNELHGIKLLSDTKGIAVGDGGKILMTTSGVNWAQKISGITAGLKDVEYINTTTIIAVGDGGTIVKSTNGGMGWTSIYSGTTEMLLSVCVNGTDIYTCGQNGVILKSTDEGNSWSSVSPGQGAHIFDVFFTSPTVGYAVGNDAHIHKTTNGGLSWTTLYDFDSGISANFQLRSIYFKDANNGFIVGKNLIENQAIIIRTTNGGATWIPQIVYGDSYVDIKFVNNNVGFIVGQNLNSYVGVISKTTDGGTNWTFLTSLPKVQNAIAFSNSGVGYTCGFNGSIFKSTNINLGIDDLENNQTLSVYPNPSSEKITITLDSSIASKNLAIHVYSISGEEIIFQSNTTTIDVSDFPTGTYFLKVQNETSSWTKTIIKE
ncbi:YCF48-related protein [Fluviicola sp.]|uniref:T9SS type A sorting domain-containing protein n=1 Tax=Fluviicola sp. TaxID=1917219 RepID=UPI00261D0063|nr:YCF48-related protein [Fluviicola sp.]